MNAAAGAFDDISADTTACGARAAVVYGEVRQDWLDWLRGASILLVLVSHYQINWRDAGAFRPLAQVDMRVGWSGVDMFFVISGFLIGGLLLREQERFGRIDMKRFYGRRAFKIWPLLYATPLAWAIYAATFGAPAGQDLARFWPVLVHIQNYVPTPLGHLWSLAVEEHFYLMLPLFVTLFGSRRLRAGHAFPAALVGVMAAVLVLRCIAAADAADDAFRHAALRLQTQYRLDAIMFGVILTWLVQARPAIWRALQDRRLLLFGMAALLLWPFAFNPNTSRLVAGPGLTSIYLSYGCLLVVVSTWAELAASRSALGKALRALAWVGRYSFPIYLFHPLIWLLFERAGFGPNRQLPVLLLGSAGLTWIVGFGIFLATAILLGAVIGRCVEKPLLAMRNRLLPGRATPLPGMTMPPAAPVSQPPCLRGGGSPCS